MTYSEDLPRQDYDTELNVIQTREEAKDRATELGHYAVNDKGHLLAQERLNVLKTRFPPVARELQEIFDRVRSVEAK